ncbi:MAG: bifunctional DNA-formamidopyrimidine glycosylase/DNA-(apurinic or apyrimidinic site) lyase [bacterium]
MPELPDVELVARRLRRSVARRLVTRVEIRDRSVVRSPAPRLFARRLRGRRIRTVGRRGKYLLVHLDRGLVVVGHLRMTGDFVVVPRHDPIRPHTRLVLGLGPRDIRFVDQRRFGHVDLIARRDLETFPSLRTLGVEPLTPAFSIDRLRALIDDRRGALKGFLLRQDLIAGIGNLYADEILFQARLHPERPLRTLRPAQVRALHRSIRAALRRGIAALSHRGRPIGDFVAVRERGGACPRCGASLRAATIAGRTTYFCPRCQR